MTNSIKFNEDYSFLLDDELVFYQKNSVVEFIDKYEGLNQDIDDCGICDEFIWYYRIMVENIVVTIPGPFVTELTEEEIVNRDYTEQEWKEKGITDALVEDGDYVKAWRDTFGINKPVKDTADQCDYDGRYKALYKKAKEAGDV